MSSDEDKAVDATIEALEAAVDQLRRIGLQTLDIQPGNESAIPEQLEVLVNRFQVCDQAIRTLPETLAAPAELVTMVDDSVSPDVFDSQRKANTSKLATQMHASGDALKTLHAELERGLEQLKESV